MEGDQGWQKVVKQLDWLNDNDAVLFFTVSLPLSMRKDGTLVVTSPSSSVFNCTTHSRIVSVWYIILEGYVL